MSPWPRLFSLLRNLFRKERVERELDAEVRSYLDALTEEKIAAGMNPQEARRAARLELGGAEQVKESVREVRAGALLEQFAQDIRYGLRMLARSPGFTAVAIVTLALGIGANTAIFSVVHAVLLRELPFAEPDRLYWMWTKHTSRDRYPFTLPEYCDYRDQNRSFEQLAAFGSWSANLTGQGDPERLIGTRVSANFFQTLGVRAAVGRTLLPDDDLPANRYVVVLTHGLWQRRFGSDPGIVGKPLALNGENYIVAGVLPPEFVFLFYPDAEVGIPLAPDAHPWRMDRNSVNFLRLVGRLKSGVTHSQAEADMNGIAQRLKAEYPTPFARKLGVFLVPVHEEIVRDFSRALWVLLGAVGTVLLIACANLANLMLIRAAARHREIAIRHALGASAARLTRQLLTESILLAFAGGALGLLLAAGGVPALVALSPAAMPRLNQIAIRFPVLLFTLGATSLAGLLFGLVPALRASRADVNEELKTEARGTGGVQHHRMRSLIVAGQVAAMVILLTGAGLLIKSFRQVQRVSPGFDEQNVLTVRLSLPQKRYSHQGPVSQFYRKLLPRLESLPGVTSVGVASQVPLNGAVAGVDYTVADRPPASEHGVPRAQYRVASRGYFRAMRIPLLAGREFEEIDTPETQPVAIVSAALVRKSFPDRDPIGQRILVDDNSTGPRPLEIVGVVGDVKHDSLESEPTGEIYVAFHQTHPDGLVWLTTTQYWVLRTQGEPLALAASVRRELLAVDAEVASSNIRTMEQYLASTVAPRRFNLLLLGMFAAVALLLAATGLYGVVSYSVAWRTREIGLRMALGAQRADILRAVLGQALRLTAIGIVLGLGGALALTRALQGLLYGVTATDPPTFAGAVLVMGSVALLACYLPARRASRLDPQATLRHG
jgi:putative ABC transport system permease protein